MKWIKHKLEISNNNREMSQKNSSISIGLYIDLDDRWVMASLVDNLYPGEEISTLDEFLILLENAGAIIDDVLITHVAPNNNGDMIEYTYSPYQAVVDLWNMKNS